MMPSMSQMSSTTSTLLSAYASLAGTMMLLRSTVNDIIPQQLRSYISSTLQRYFFTPLSSNLTLLIDDYCGYFRNDLYDAADAYLSTKITPSVTSLKVDKTPRQKSFTLSIEKGQEITDSFDDVKLTWILICKEPQNQQSSERRYFELIFDKRFKDKVLDAYLPHVMARSAAIREEEKVVKLYTMDCTPMDYEGWGVGGWGSINLEHPATFETLAMDPELKRSIIEDLERFVRRREFYKKVGKAWKRGYLLYGPPGTGKSSLIAAMANYLKFDIFDLELSSLNSNSGLRRVLLSTTNRSILVIEDIDCNAEAQDREDKYESYDYKPPSNNTKLTLSGLLNFIDGLWSSCGDERIIVFTTNHKERLDPALLRPGRMDVHIHMSYCTPSGFKILASNYLGIGGNHRLFGEVLELIESIEVTPAEVAEELMKSDDADLALEGLINFLKRKKIEGSGIKEVANGMEPRKGKRLRVASNEKGVQNKRKRTIKGRSGRR